MLYARWVYLRYPNLAVYLTTDVVADFESCGAISAAAILTSNIVRIRSSRNYNRNEIAQASIALRAIHQARAILSANGGSRSQRMMGRLRLAFARK